MLHEDHYAVLGVDDDASAEDLKRAYRQQARASHPDVNPEPDAALRFRQVTEAFRVLSDPTRPRAYDRKRGTVRRRPPPPAHVEREAHADVQVAGINLGGLLGISVKVRTRPLFGDDDD